MGLKIKPNCQRCFYGGVYRPNEQLASCGCENVTEQTVVDFDPLFKKERQWVSRKNWADECDCERFIPHLSEVEGDYELEPICLYNAVFDCPFCGNMVYVLDIGIEKTEIVTCNECNKQIAVQGKAI